MKDAYQPGWLDSMPHKQLSPRRYKIYSIFTNADLLTSRHELRIGQPLQQFKQILSTDLEMKCARQED